MIRGGSYIRIGLGFSLHLLITANRAKERGRRKKLRYKQEKNGPWFCKASSLFGDFYMNIWNVCTSIVNIRLQSSIVLNDVLHGFRQGKGTWTAIIEAKMEQKVAGIVHEPLFQLFVDVRKA